MKAVVYSEWELTQYHGRSFIKTVIIFYEDDSNYTEDFIESVLMIYNQNYHRTTSRLEYIIDVDPSKNEIDEEFNELLKEQYKEYIEKQKAKQKEIDEEDYKQYLKLKNKFNNRSEYTKPIVENIKPLEDVKPIKKERTLIDMLLGVVK